MQTLQLLCTNLKNKNSLDNNNASANVSVDNSPSFKYKPELLGTSTGVGAGDDPNNPLAHR